MTYNAQSGPPQGGPPKGASGGNGKGLSLSDMENMLSKPQFSTIAKEFVHPGKTVPDLLMRTYFKDRRELNCAVLFYKKCEEFSIEDGKDILRYLMAGATSIGGAARKDLLQAIVGQLAPNIYKATPYRQMPKDQPSQGREGL